MVKKGSFLNSGVIGENALIIANVSPTATTFLLLFAQDFACTP